MKIKKISAVILTMIIAVGTFFFGTFTANAAIEYTTILNGVTLTYTVSNGEASITNCDTSISGDAEIPTTIGGYPVTSIESYAFSKCTRITSITIPNSVTSIGSHAFYKCTSLISITLPFVGSSRNVSDSYTAVFGYIFGYITSDTNDKSGTTYQYYSGYSYYTYTYYCYYIPSSLKSVIITDATQIPNRAFHNCENLTSITIPNSVTNIGQYTFYYCKNLASITVPASVANIGQYAFSGCYSLKSVYYCGTAEQWNNISIGSNNSYLTNIPRYFHKYDNSCDTSCNICNFIRIITHAYDTCDDTECNVCGYTRTVEPHIFDGSDDIQCNNCDYVRYIMFDITNGEVTILGYIDGFSGAITIPETLCGYPVTDIADTAFAGCNTLSRITIAGNIKNIPDSAFKDCTKLLRVTINDGVESISANAFDGCVNLINVILPSTVAEIGTNAFYNCGDLKIISISDIKAWCETDFGNAYSNPLYYAPTLNLNEKKVTALELPTGVTTVKNYAFYNYKALSNITFPDTVETIGKSAFYGCSSLTDIAIPGSVTSIGFSAFEGCNSLASMTVPFVGENAEENNNFGYIFGSERIIDNVLYVPESLKSITVSNNCRLIPKSAFENCQYIECLTLPFIGGSELGNRFLGYIFGADYSEENANYIPSALSKIIITDNCVGIAEMAFYGCENLKEIIIPESIVAIGKDAFENCASLQSIYISNLTAWCNINFVNEYANPVYYGDLYLNGELLTVAELSEEVTEIKDYAFINCDSLKFIEFTESINTIGDYSFYGCSQIAEIILPNNTMGIGIYAFYGCENLTRLDTGDYLELIDAYAFYNTGLIDIYLGEGIWYIDENAFGLCENIACVYYSGDSDMWEMIYIEELGNESLINATKKYNSSPLAEVGDLNGDGKIDIRDLVKLKKILVGSAESDKTTSDLDRNGKTNSMDITVLIKFLLGNIANLKQALL